MCGKRESLAANGNDLISVSLKIIRAPSSGRGRRAKRGGVGFRECGSTVSRGQPPPLRGTSFQRKEGKWQIFLASLEMTIRERHQSQVSRGAYSLVTHLLLTVSMLRASSKDLRRLFPPLHMHLRRQRLCAGSGYRLLFQRIRRGDGSSHRHRRPWY